MAAPTQGRFLACDIGNTHICFGIFTGSALETAWRIRTDPKETEDELKAAILQIITFNGIRREDVGGAIVASVVPPLTETMVGCLQTLFGVKVIVVGPGIKTGVSVLMENPREVGADRIVNAIAASTKYPGGSIVVDTGTATTFDCISPAAEYLGGAIAPGIAISSEALFLRAAKLPKIEIAKPPRCVGKNTVESMQSGIFYGYLGLIDGLIERLK
jgi:type III pantothenate kinase